MVKRFRQMFVEFMNFIVRSGDLKELKLWAAASGISR